MARHDVQLALVQDLLAAPGSTEGWSAFLLRLCDALGGSAASFISHEFGVNGTGISVTARTDPEALSAYQEHWARIRSLGAQPCDDSLDLRIGRCGGRARPLVP